jgi:hypothetical protein
MTATSASQEKVTPLPNLPDSDHIQSRIIPLKGSQSTHFSGTDHRLVQAFRRIGEMTAAGRNRLATLSNEEPLKLLAVIAGVAAVAGIATRVWRSTR